jgi:NADH-quinone oxidoreductase subunit L
MLALVVVDSLITFYAFWELVGFSSYLLIGFWYDRDSAVQANKKAFIMNRIGDIGLLTAIIILFTQFGTFDLYELFKEGGLVAQSVINNGEWVAGLSHIPGHLALHRLRRHLPSRRSKICTIPITYLAARCHGRAYFGFGT